MNVRVAWPLACTAPDRRRVDQKGRVVHDQAGTSVFPVTAASISGFAPSDSVPATQPRLQHQLGGLRRVEEVVALGCMPHATGLQQDRAICADAMAAADVTHLSQRSYLTLSGGERQRVHLARVLAQVWEVGEGGCLLLDEPTASLDLAHQRLIMQQARAMASRGLSVLVVLHDLNLAAAFADRVLLLHEGRLDALGTPWQVLQADHIERVFGVAVQVQRHPQHDCPLVIL